METQFVCQGCANAGHKARLACGDRCRKATRRLRKQEEARRQEEAVRRQRQERWQVFMPSTLRCLERLEAFDVPGLAEELVYATVSVSTEGTPEKAHFEDVLEERALAGKAELPKYPMR